MCHINKLSVKKFKISSAAESHQIGIILIFIVLCNMHGIRKYLHSLAIKGKDTHFLPQMATKHVSGVSILPWQLYLK